MGIDISIIIINWNSLELLKKCLDSIYQFTSNLNFEIIVVDNASYDGTGEYLKKHYNAILFIQSPKNLGFAKANNLGYTHAKGKYLIFLNPDTELMDNAFDTIYSYANLHPDVGALGCTLLNSDLSLQYSCYQFFPSLFNELLDVKSINIIKMKNVFTKKLSKDRTGRFEAYLAKVISGACFVVKREVFEAVGMFTELFFMYSEDMDLSYKIHKQGFKSHFLRNVKIIHHGGKSTEKVNTSFFSVSMQKTSRYLFYTKEKGILYAEFFKLCILISSLIRLSAILLFMLPILLTAKRYKFINTWGKWQTAFRWATSTIGDQ